MKDETKIKIKDGILVGSIVLFLGGEVACVFNFSNYIANRETSIHYYIDEDGNYKIKGSVSYDQLEEYKLIEFKNVTGERELLIGKPVIPPYKSKKYEDIFTIFELDVSDSKIEIINEDSLSNYLYKYNEVKAEYTEKDLKRIFNKIKENYVFENDKVKTK